MQLKHPEYLLGMFLFALLLFLTSKIRRRRGLSYSSTIATAKLPFIWYCLAILPKVLYMLLVSMLLLALAAPFQEEQSTETVIIGKVLVPCIDVSGSMNSAAYEDGPTKLEVIKNILKDFLLNRDEVDSVGLTAFSGGGDGWGAGVIQYPTLDKKLFIASSKRITGQLFGSSTAIGEGIFMSILALNENAWNKKMRLGSDDPNDEFDILRLWNAVNALDLPEIGLPNKNTRSEDNTIIAEALRLTPPEENRHKVIILFSDGDSNTGLDPKKSIWLADRLGIKVYYIEVREDIDSQNDPDHLKELRGMVAASGGQYFAGNNYNDVRKFFFEISKLEKNEITTKIKYHDRESYHKFLWIAALLLLTLIAIENIFPSN